MMLCNKHVWEKFVSHSLEVGNYDSFSGLKLKIHNNILITHQKKVYDLTCSDSKITKYFNLEHSIRNA
jgi:hypothetical protein